MTGAGGPVDGWTRRGVLGGLSAAGLAGLLAACGGSPAPVAPPSPPPLPGSPPPSPSPPTASPTVPPYPGESRSVALCAAVAGLGTEIYGVAVSRGGQNRYGTVPAAVTALLTAAGAQHSEHRDAWNGVLAAAGQPAVTGAPLTVTPAVRSRLEAARSPLDLLTLVTDLEQTTRATVTSVLGLVSEPAAVALAAGVAPVAAAHGATAAYLLGRLPSPPADPTAGALDPAVLTV